MADTPATTEESKPLTKTEEFDNGIDKARKSFNGFRVGINKLSKSVMADAYDFYLLTEDNPELYTKLKQDMSVWAETKVGDKKTWKIKKGISDPREGASDFITIVKLCFCELRTGQELKDDDLPVDDTLLKDKAYHQIGRTQISRFSSILEKAADQKMTSKNMASYLKDNPVYKIEYENKGEPTGGNNEEPDDPTILINKIQKRTSEFVATADIKIDMKAANAPTEAGYRTIAVEVDKDGNVDLIGFTKDTEDKVISAIKKMQDNPKFPEEHILYPLFMAKNAIKALGPNATNPAYIVFKNDGDKCKVVITFLGLDMDVMPIIKYEGAAIKGLKDGKSYSMPHTELANLMKLSRKEGGTLEDSNGVMSMAFDNDYISFPAPKGKGYDLTGNAKTENSFMIPMELLESWKVKEKFLSGNKKHDTYDLELNKDGLLLTDIEAGVVLKVPIDVGAVKEPVKMKIAYGVLPSLYNALKTKSPANPMGDMGTYQTFHINDGMLIIEINDVKFYIPSADDKSAITKVAL